MRSFRLQAGVTSVADPAVAAHVSAKHTDCFTVATNARLILMNQAVTGMVMAIKGKAALILLKLPSKSLQLLLIRPEIAGRSGLAQRHWRGQQ